MKVILHQDITIHFDPVTLCAFSEIALKVPSISIIPENLLPVDLRAPSRGGRHRQTQSEEVVTPFPVITLKS